MMAIDARAEVFNGVVEVEDFEEVETDDGVELCEDVVIGIEGGEVIACGVSVAGIKADAEEGWRIEEIEDVAELLEVPTESGSLSGGVFEEECDIGPEVVV